MSISYEFSGRVAIVTGAARGIGLSIASLLADSGATVVAVDYQETALKEAWESRGNVITHPADVSRPESGRSAVARAISDCGGIDILVNNAGIVRDTVVWKMSDEDWDQVIAVHLKGTFNFTRAAIPEMRKAGYGRIINVTSFTGLHGNFGQANYAAAKAGIVGFSKTVAKETARFGITVNVIAPNAMTPMVSALTESQIASLNSVVPMGRFGTTEEMAWPVAFLASEQAGYMTGVVLPVDGGLNM